LIYRLISVLGRVSSIQDGKIRRSTGQSLREHRDLRASLSPAVLRDLLFKSSLCSSVTVRSDPLDLASLDLLS